MKTTEYVPDGCIVVVTECFGDDGTFRTYGPGETYDRWEGYGEVVLLLPGEATIAEDYLYEFTGWSTIKSHHDVFYVVNIGGHASELKLSR